MDILVRLREFELRDGQECPSYALAVLDFMGTVDNLVCAKFPTDGQAYPSYLS